MKRVVVLILTALLLSANSSVIHATDSSSSARQREEVLRMKKETQEKREAAREEAKKRIEEAKKKLEERREETKARIQEIKDERKRNVVENIDARLKDRNERWVEHWNNVLDRLSKILDKIESRSVEIKEKGKDTTTIDAAIAKARAAISSAQSKVDAQAAKSYEIVVTTEDKLGTVVSAEIAEFKSDVSAVVASINEARKAVQAVFEQVKLII